MTMLPLVDMKMVSKKIGEKTILENVSFTVNKGEIVGIVGTNGSGKTTLLRLIAGLSYVSSGELKVNGKKVKPGMMGNLPENIGVLIETPSFINYQTGFENLYNLAQIQRRISGQGVEESILKVGLDPKSKKKVREYSLGMKQRLGIAQALMESPSLVLFDEPTNGLDQEGRDLFFKYVTDLKNQGTGFVFVSHHEHEIAEFCDRVFRIEGGILVAQQQKRNISIQLFNPSDVAKVLSAVPESTMSDRKDGNLVMIIPFSVGMNDEEIDSFFKKIGVEFNHIKEES